MPNPAYGDAIREELDTNRIHTLNRDLGGGNRAIDNVPFVCVDPVERVSSTDDRLHFHSDCYTPMFDNQVDFATGHP